MKNKGFTIVELLTIICILGIIIGIAVPVSNNILTAARENKLIADARTVINNIELYINENNYVIPTQGIDIHELDLDIQNIESYNGYVIYNGSEVELESFTNGSICGKGTIKDFKIISCN